MAMTFLQDCNAGLIWLRPHCRVVMPGYHLKMVMNSLQDCNANSQYEFFAGLLCQFDTAMTSLQECNASLTWL